MGIVIVGFIVGVAYLVATLFQVKKSAKNLEDVDLKKYTKVDNSKTYIYFLILLSIFSILGLYLGLSLKNDQNTSFGIMLLFLSIAEMFNAKTMQSFYYNDTHFIVNSKVIRFKSIKQLTKAPSFFIKRYELLLINGDKELISSKTAKQIESLRASKK